MLGCCYSTGRPKNTSYCCGIGYSQLGILFCWGDSFYPQFCPSRSDGAFCNEFSFSCSHAVKVRPIRKTPYVSNGNNISPAQLCQVSLPPSRGETHRNADALQPSSVTGIISPCLTPQKSNCMFKSVEIDVAVEYCRYDEWFCVVFMLVGCMVLCFSSIYSCAECRKSSWHIRWSLSCILSRSSAREQRPLVGEL